MKSVFFTYPGQSPWPADGRSQWSQQSHAQSWWESEGWCVPACWWQLHWVLAFLSNQQAPSHPGHLANVLSTSTSRHSQRAKLLNKPHGSYTIPIKRQWDCCQWQDIPPAQQSQDQLFRVYSQIQKTWIISWLWCKWCWYWLLVCDDVRIVEKSDQTVDVLRHW